MKQELSRPFPVWVISIGVGLLAATQITLLSSLFVVQTSSSSARDLVERVPVFDWLTLYVLAFVLLTSMVWFFRLRKRAVTWFAAYVGLGSLAVFGWSGGPRQPFFDELVSLAGLLVALLIYAYMLHLRRNAKLV